MFNLKNKTGKERFSVGLDIGTATVKFVKLKVGADKPELKAFGIEPVAVDISTVLRKIKQAQAMESVNLSVSGTSSVIRYVNFPKMTKSELRQALKFEAQKHIPFSISDVNLDGFILKDDLADNKMLVLLAAVKKDLIASRIKTIEDAGLKVNIIDIDSLALINAFNLNFSSSDLGDLKTVALLNIGAANANLDILEQLQPRLSRDIHFAGNAFTQKIADVFNLDLNAAESLKLNPDAERSNKVTAAVESVLTNLAAEIRTSFDYYESQSASAVSKIYLSGAGSRFNGLKDMLTNFLSIEVVSWDPLLNITLGEGVDSAKVKESSEQLAVAVGLALR